MRERERMSFDGASLLTVMMMMKALSGPRMRQLKWKSISVRSNNDNRLAGMARVELCYLTKMI